MKIFQNFGQTATAAIRHDLTHVEEIGKNAVDTCLDVNSQKVCKVKLHTFADMQSKHKLPPQGETTIAKRSDHTQTHYPAQSYRARG